MQIKVNADEWGGLSEIDREKIRAVVGSFFKGAEIVSDEHTPRSGVDTQSIKVSGFLCTAACNVAQAAATAACASLVNPIAIAACVALASAAGDECRKLC